MCSVFAHREDFFMVRSNPISFALRPLVAHKQLRITVGVNLAILAVLLAIYGPLPTFAGDSIGGPLEVNVRSEGEVNLTTVESVQIPVSNFRLTQGYSWYHPGVDLAALKGESVRPVMVGQVTKVETGRFGYGNNVTVIHPNGYQSLYAHLSKIEVTEGQTVALSDQVGQVGSTGRSSGPHLHLEISANGSSVNPKVLLDLK